MIRRSEHCANATRAPQAQITKRMKNELQAIAHLKSSSVPTFRRSQPVAAFHASILAALLGGDHNKPAPFGRDDFCLFSSPVMAPFPASTIR
jgi:hypothetical protein